jgi:phosphoribosylanthranilate isomerase
MVRVKICGVTTPADAAFAADCGADAVGLNFYPKSPRFLRDELAEAIVRELPAFTTAVGVFVDPAGDAIRDHARRFGLRAVQTYAADARSESFFPAAHIPAFRVKDAADLDGIRRLVAACRPAAVLVDSFVSGAMGGTGHQAPWHLLAGFDPGVPLILAGGLTPDNVADAIRLVRPWGVDVASGVESAPGRKDPGKVRAFLDAVRAAG